MWGITAMCDPGPFTYPDRESAERGLEKLRAEDPLCEYAIVEATPAFDRTLSLVEGSKCDGLFGALWDAVQDFNKEQILSGAPPATCTEIVRSIAWAIEYVTTYLGEPSGGTCGVISPECEDVTIEDFVRELGCTRNKSLGGD